MGLKTGIWASRPGSEGGGTEKEEKEEEKKEKIPYMCESIGHRPLRCRCPKQMNEYGKDKEVVWMKKSVEINRFTFIEGLRDRPTDRRTRPLKDVQGRTYKCGVSKTVKRQSEQREGHNQKQEREKEREKERKKEKKKERKKERKVYGEGNSI